jgi:DNA-binding response OmpR family regulator
VAAPAPPTAQALLTGKVLIVEDDRHIAKALAVRLRAAGLEVLIAGDALSGLDMAVRQQPDLVLLDIGLPAGSGLKVAERIQTLLPKLTPIIFLTASRQPGLREQALKLDPVDYFEKPYDADRLLEAVQRALACRV